MENEKTTIMPPKTVIFRHPAAVLKLDENIRRNAMYINQQKRDDKESVGNYFLSIIKAADSKKQYVVIDYNQEIVYFLHLLITYSYNYRFKDWNFIAFFHDDDASGTKQTSPAISDDLKRNVLKNLLQFGFIVKHAITPDYTVTEQDLKAIKDFWKEAEHINPFKERFTIQRKPPFPFYDCSSALGGIESQGEKNRITA